MRAVTVEVVGLQQQHVAAIAAPVERATGGRAVLHWRDQLDELVAEGVHGVVDAELRYARIAVWRIKRQQCGELPRGRGEVTNDKDDLANTQHMTTRCWQRLLDRQRVTCRETAARAFP